MSQASRLSVLVDGNALGDDEARALWTEFSAHMDEHKGDMAGFAKKKGWFAVAPEYRQGKAVLVVRTVEKVEKAAPPPAEGRPGGGGKRRRPKR